MTKQIFAGRVAIGGGAPISIQSMLSVASDDVAGNIAQAQALQTAGCQIVRVSVPDMASVRLISALKEAVTMPVVADIHFDYRLALEATEAGADKIRINPGNIGGEERVGIVARTCRDRGIPIRIGVNSGSVEKHILERFGGPTAEALVESAFGHVSMLERFDFTDIVLSLKASHLKTMLDAYRLAHVRFSYPLHVGVTEAGTLHMGLIKSAIGIGSLLADGIGDTIRVSLTADPVAEIAAARDILRAVEQKGSGPHLVCCPTCGRTRIDVIGMASEVERRLEHIDSDLTVAVMGCAVNGPGEAREADVGIAGGDGCGILFAKGRIVQKLPEDCLLDALMAKVEELSHAT